MWVQYRISAELEKIKLTLALKSTQLKMGAWENLLERAWSNTDHIPFVYTWSIQMWSLAPSAQYALDMEWILDFLYNVGN